MLEQSYIIHVNNNSKVGFKQVSTEIQLWSGWEFAFTCNSTLQSGYNR